MAEIVGVVAAGIAFGEVVIKISSHVFTLKHMWKEFREMPDSIKQLVEGIELLGSVLQEMEADMTISTADGIVWGGGVGSLIVEACRSALNTLSLSVNDVSQEVRATRGIKAALRKGKMVLNKEFWAKTEKRLQDVVGRLQIAQQWWLMLVETTENKCSPTFPLTGLSSALSKRQTELIVCRLQPARIEPQLRQGEAPSETREEMDNVPSQRHRTYTLNEAADRRQYELTREHLGQTLIGSMAVERARSSDGSMNGSSCDKYYIQVKPPNWITRKAWSIVSSISSGGFNLNLRVYSVVPRRSLVMDYAIQGDIKGLLGLFDRNLASPFDVNEDGKGLLDHLIYESCDTRAIARMVDWGLDLTKCLDPRERLATVIFLMQPESIPASRSVHEFAVANNLYEDVSDWWLSPSDTSKPLGQWSLAYKTSWSRDSLQLFLPHFRPGHYRMQVLDRLLLATRLPCRQADDLRYVLWIDGKVQREDIHALDEIGFPLVSFIAKKQIDIPLDEDYSVAFESWRQLLREVAGLTTLLHSTEPPQAIMEAFEDWNISSGTALYTILEFWTYCHPWSATLLVGLSLWRQTAQRQLQNWLEDLQKGGVDLEKYGQEEIKIFREMNWFELKYFQINDWPYVNRPPITYTPIGFSYGPEPKDWKLEWELDSDGLVGEFWELIYNQEIRIVGAWVD